MNELKILADTGDSLTIGGYAAVFGGEDLQGDRFEPTTDFWLEKLSATPPILYQHGHDSLLGEQVIGRVTTTKTDSVGLWITAQLKTSRDYLQAIRELIARGVIGLSIGS